MVSVRTSGQLVLDELLHVADGAAGSLAGAVRRRMDEAAQAKVLPPAEIAALCTPSTYSMRGAEWCCFELQKCSRLIQPPGSPSLQSLLKVVLQTFQVEHGWTSRQNNA